MSSLIQSFLDMIAPSNYSHLKRDDGEQERKKAEEWSKKLSDFKKPFESNKFLEDREIENITTHIKTSLRDIVICSSNYELIRDGLMDMARKSYRLQQNIIVMTNSLQSESKDLSRDLCSAIIFTYTNTY